MSRPLPLRAVPSTAVNLDPSAPPAPDRPARTIPPEVPESTARYVLQAVLALSALILLSPILVLVAIAVKLTSPGPLFYAGVRTGRNQKLYTMYKFRTLREGSERQIGGRLLSAQDDFYTPIGKFLKRSKLDEVPQLINVLLGEMSVVGPRPEQVELVGRYTDEQRARLAAKPGVTGPMQVFGRGELTFAERIEMEIEYIDNQSLARDVRILIHTVPAVFRGTGAF